MDDSPEAAVNWIRFALPAGESVTLRSAPEVALHLSLERDSLLDEGYGLPRARRTSVTVRAVARDLESIDQAHRMVREVRQLLLAELTEFSIEAEGTLPDRRHALVTIPRLRVEPDFSPSVSFGLSRRVLEADVLAGAGGSMYTLTVPTIAV